MSQHEVLSNIRCPICGDSQLNPDAMRGYFLKLNTGHYAYKCFNEIGDDHMPCHANDPITYRRFMQLVIAKHKLNITIPPQPNEFDVRALLEMIK
jgi:hypothetical protein